MEYSFFKTGVAETHGTFYNFRTTKKEFFMFTSKLGIQSWCFHTYKETEKVIEALGKCGVDKIELCGVHLDVHSPAGTLQQYRDNGITVTSFGVHYFSTDEAVARKVFEFACLAGFPAISADLDLNALDMVEKLCAEYGKKIAIHNHGRKHRLGPVWALEELFRRSSDNIGFCLDTAWMLDAGEDPLAIAGKFRERLYGTHIKDFVFDRAGHPEDVVVGTGNLDLKAYLDYLRATDYQGYLTLEYEGDADNPVPALVKCVKAIRES